MICLHEMDAKGANCIRCRKTAFECQNWDSFSDKQRANHEALIEKRRVYLVVGSGEYLVYPHGYYTHVVKVSKSADPSAPGYRQGYFPHQSFGAAAGTVDELAKRAGGRKDSYRHIMELMQLPVGMKFPVTNQIGDSITIDVPESQMHMIAEGLASGKYVMEPGPGFREISIMPGAIREQKDVPVTRGFGGPQIGVAHVKGDGTFTAVIQDQATQEDIKG